MKVENVIKWIEVDHEASSLLNEIVNKTWKEMKGGKNGNPNVTAYKWKTLVNGSCLQKNSNKEGFNFFTSFETAHGHHYMKVRIGFVANNQNDCKTPNSCIGFGISVRGCGRSVSTACGNVAVCGSSADVRNTNIPVFGFILVH